MRLPKTIFKEGNKFAAYPNGEVATARISLRIHPEDKELIHRYAQAAGLSDAEYIRRRALNISINQKVGLVGRGSIRAEEAQNAHNHKIPTTN